MKAADLPRRSHAPTVAGTESPTAWGHRFGASLVCDWCGTTWSAHEERPRPCTRVPADRQPDDADEPDDDPPALP
jgi:hypothetical protein